MPHAVSVTKKHFPNMLHLGDITQIDGGKIPPVDIITFGSPCQDLSVAGRRLGLAGARSSLFMEAVRIIEEMRCATENQYPKYAVWENVPGALSSGKPKGADFKAVLESLTKTEIPVPPCGTWANAGGYEVVGSDSVSIAWRIFDAQYWGVPQRRRRIFLVASFGEQCPGEILFIEEGLRGDNPQGEEPRENPAGIIGNGFDLQDSHGISGADRSKTAYGICSQSSNSMKNPKNPYSGIYEAETSRTLDSHCNNPTNNQGGLVIVESQQSENQLPIVILNDQGGDSMTVEKSDKSPTLRSEAHGNLPIVVKEVKAIHEAIGGDSVHISDIAYALRSGRKPLVLEEVNLHPDIAPTLTASAGGTSRPGGGQGSELDYYIAYSLQGNMIGRQDHNGPAGGGINENICFSQNTIDRHAVAYFNHTHTHAAPSEGDVASCQTARQFKKTPVDLVVHKNFVNNGMMSIKESDVANTQTARQYKGTMDYLVSVNANGGHSKYTEGVFGTLARSGGEMGGGGESLVVEPFYIVRRLTPTECERLQGFPDDWTKFGGDNDKQIADTPRYAMLGNSVAIPVVRFVLGNIARVERVKMLESM